MKNKIQKEYNPNLPIYWTMHDLIAVCPSYTMLDGNGNICEKCLNKDFNNPITDALPLYTL